MASVRRWLFLLQSIGMPRGERYNPYQLPFDFDAQPLNMGHHVRLLKEPITLHAPFDAAAYLLDTVFTPFHEFRQEYLYVLLVDTKLRITHDVMVYKGTVNRIYVRTAELFMEAVKANAPGVILSHCHPSGDPTPSPEDIRVTELAYEAGQKLDITIHDHIIVGNNSRWVSLKEKGLGLSSGLSRSTDIE